MADNGVTPNVRSMVNDPQFTGLPPVQQREALYKLTKDGTFKSLSDADTAHFVSRMSQAATPTATIGAYNPSFGQRLSDFVQPFMEHVRVGGVARAVFSAQTLRGAYDELPEFRAAWDRGDWQQAERTGTHILLGAVMAGIGVKHAATGESVPMTEGPVKNSLYEGYRRTGQYFDNLRKKSVTLNTISESATGVYNSVRQDLITHQEALRNDGSRTIQDAITADKAALMNTNRGSIPTAKVVGEAAKMLDATGYEMKPAERTLFNRVVNNPELTLEDAKLIRTAVGRVAFGRSSLAPEAKAVFTTAYKELGEGMKARIQELQGTTRPYEHYNTQFNTSFELEDGIAGEMMQSLQGQDRHAAMPKLGKFADANLDEIQEQMKKIGLDQQSKSLEKAQAHARSLVGAYDVGNGKYMSGIYRLFMQNPKQAWPGLAVMTVANGMRLPFPGPQIAGAIVASGHIGTRARGEAARIGQELKSTLPPSISVPALKPNPRRPS